MGNVAVVVDLMAVGISVMSIHRGSGWRWRGLAGVGGSVVVQVS